MRMKQLLPLLVLLNFHLIQVSGVLDWTVIGKVTEYGQDVTLLCTVSNCCPDDAGWDRYSPEQRTLFIDIKTRHFKKKYDGKALNDGYTLVIKNLTKKDLNVSYSCVYGVTIGPSKFLLEEDVFTYMSDTTPNLPPDNITLSEIKIIGIIIGIVVSVAVAVVLFVVYFRQKRNHRYRDKEEPVEGVALLESEKTETNIKGIFATEDEAISLDTSLEIQNTQNIKDGTYETEHNVEERKKHIRELIYHDTCVKHHYSRVMFIGKQTVGKTSLMRRLLGMKKDKVVETKSTDGIDISKCMINVEDGKWRPCNETDDDLTRLIHRVFTEKTDKTQIVDVNKSGGNNTDTDTEIRKDIKYIDETKMSDTHSVISTDVDVKAYTETKEDNYEITEQKSQQSVVQDDNKLYEHSDDVSSRSDLDDLQNDKLDNDDKLDDSLIMRSNSTPISNIESNLLVIKEIEDESLENESNSNLNKMTSDIMDHCFKSPDISQPQDPFASCWLWDFAGQNDFYATHQTFMSRFAVYILVADSLEFSETEALWVDFETSAQYVRFWCDAVHCYSSTMANKEHLDPAIIIVHTKKDRYQDVATQKAHHSEFVANIAKVLRKQEQKKHIREIYHVSNTEDEEQDFEKIRNTISKLAMEMESWGIQIPLKWFLFQQVIEKLKENKVSCSTTLKVQRIAKHEVIGITDDDDFKDCLHYFHNVGTIIYYDEEGLRENIILDPKWLVDAFRCLVSNDISDTVRISDDWVTFSQFGKLTKTLLHKLLQKQTDHTSDFNANTDHLVEVMIKFDIIVKMKDSFDLYMPCMMEDCSLDEIKKKLISDKFDKTSWLVLRFDFLPPVFFNHIVAVYIKQFEVSQILDKRDRFKRHALYRKIAVFNIPGSNCKQLIIGQAPSIMAVQIWYSKGEHTQEYSKYRRTLCDIVQSLKSRYKLSIGYEIQFACKNGNFAIEQRTWADLKEPEYLCSQHDREKHSSGELFNCWYDKDYFIKKRVVAAIDFGIDFSSFAYSTRDDYDAYLKKKKDQLNMKCHALVSGRWQDVKAPTSVLFRPNQKLHSFGYDAHSYYQKNPDKVDFSKWFYFENFLLMFFKEKEALTKYTWLEESINVAHGKKKKMIAVDVVAAVISYIQGMILNELKQEDEEKAYNNDDIHWVFTVPATLDQKATQFMRDAAKNVNSSNDQLTLIHEPDAVYIHCREQSIAVELSSVRRKNISGLQKGDKYVVYNKQGGTTCTVHEVTGPNSVRFIHQACERLFEWKTDAFNGQIYNFLVKLLGRDVITEMKEHHEDDFVELMERFENAKTGFREDNSFVRIRLPVTLLKCIKNTDTHLEDVIPQTTLNGQMIIKKDKMTIANSLFLSIFDYPLVTADLARLFRMKELSNVHTLLVVGDFSESSELIHAIEQKLGPNIDVIVPKDPRLAVLNGAIMYSFEPEVIETLC